MIYRQQNEGCCCFAAFRLAIESEQLGYGQTETEPRWEIFPLELWDNLYCCMCIRIFPFFFLTQHRLWMPPIRYHFANVRPNIVLLCQKHSNKKNKQHFTIFEHVLKCSDFYHTCWFVCYYEKNFFFVYFKNSKKLNNKKIIKPCEFQGKHWKNIDFS